LCDEFSKLKIVANTEVVEMEVGSSLLQEICRGQEEDKKIQEIRRNIKEEKSPDFLEDDQGVLWYKGMICVPNVKELKDKILHRLMNPLIPFIQEGIRCTMISRPLIGSMV
jgi:hypothetical protein